MLPNHEAAKIEILRMLETPARRRRKQSLSTPQACQPEVRVAARSKSKPKLLVGEPSSMNAEYSQQKFSQEHHDIFERSLRSGHANARKDIEQNRISSTFDFRQTYLPGHAEKAKTAADKHLFQQETVKLVIGQILEDQLNNRKYQADSCRTLCLNLCEMIKARVKLLGMTDHRLVCSVSIGSKRGQGVFIASRSLWDTPTDNFATCTFQNASLFAVAMVFGITQK